MGLWCQYEIARLLQCVLSGKERAHPMFAFASSDWEWRLAAKLRSATQRGDSVRREAPGGLAARSRSGEFVRFGGAGRTLGGRASSGVERRRWAGVAQGQE